MLRCKCISVGQLPREPLSLNLLLVAGHIFHTGVITFKLGLFNTTSSSDKTELTDVSGNDEKLLSRTLVISL